MNKSKNFLVGRRALFPVLLVSLFLLVASFNYSATAANPAAAAAESASPCAANGRCKKLKATLRKLETNSGKLNRMQLLKQVRAACDEMRRRNCPGIKNYQPTICFTDF